MCPETTRVGWYSQSDQNGKVISQATTNLLYQATIVAVKQRDASQIFLYQAVASMENRVTTFPTSDSTVKLRPSVTSRKCVCHIFNRLCLQQNIILKRAEAETGNNEPESRRCLAALQPKDW
jgi:hypothetical protein